MQRYIFFIDKYDSSVLFFSSMIECGCSNFISNFLCAACNNHWEQHETFVERGSEREQQKLPTGEFYMPFAELPDMQQVIFTGSDAHMPSPYLDAAPRRPIQQGGESRGRAAAIRKCLQKYNFFSYLKFFFIRRSSKSTSDWL